MKRTLISSLLLTLMLSACGGGGNDPATGSQVSGGSQGNGPGNGNGNGQGNDDGSGQGGGQAGTLLASQAQRIAYYGDSTIWGCTGDADNSIPTTCSEQQRVQTPAPLVFEDYLRNHASAAQSVDPKGVSGQTACQLLGLRGEAWRTEMTNSNATVIILNHGINDANLGREGRDAYRGCLTNLARTAKDAGKRVIFETPNPVDNNLLDGYVQIMLDVAGQEGLSVINQYEKWNAELEQLGGDRGVMLRQHQSPDGTHPSEDFYRKKGEYAAQVYLQLPR